MTSNIATRGRRLGRRLGQRLGFCAVTALIAASTALPADARGPESIKDGIVTACSSYSNGCYRAHIRKGPLGAQMRLKGGTWVDCEGDCRDTLRRKTIDFWETLQEDAGGH